MSRNILVPVDGSQHSLVALDIATELASGEGDVLNLLYVTEPDGIPEGLKRFMEVEHVEGPLEPQYQKLVSTSVLREASERAVSGGATVAETAVSSGNPAEQIVKTALDCKASIIVMGNRGLGAIKGLAYGSVSQKVNHLAECMVITVGDADFI